MRITNKKGYPAALVKAVKYDSYSRGGANRSVTGLLAPPQQAALRELYADQIVEDVSDLTFALYGQLVHLLLERAGEQSRNQINETRFFAEVNGWTISGQTDSLTQTENKKSLIITDYKFVTAYKFKRNYSGELVVPEEYVQQLNLYAYLLKSGVVPALGMLQENNERMRFPVDGLKIVAIYRDWSKMEAKRDSTYPQLGAETHDVPLWSEERAKAFIEERVRLHQEAENADALYRLPECSNEERWARPDKYALMPTAKSARARKLFDTNDSALDFVNNPRNKVKEGWVLEYRPGANVRCENYCNVAQFCDQFDNIKRTQA